MSLIIFVFQIQCPEATSIGALNFHSSNFCGNKLGPYWIQSDLPIDEICFQDTYLNEITDDAFSQSIFFDLTSLSIIDSNVSFLRRSIFRKLSNLRFFLVHDNIVHSADSNLLEHVASTLEVLEFDRSINNIQVLNNITGKGSLLNVQILSIQGNYLHALTAETFRGVENVQSLYIDKSEISRISANVFQPFQLLSQLFIRNNKLTILPQGILDPILNRRDNTDFRMAISNNPWHCNCSLNWLKKLMQNHELLVIDSPICVSPENVAYRQIKLAEMCDADATMISTSEKYQDDAVNVSCKNFAPILEYKIISRKLQSVDYQFRNKMFNFSVHELTNGSIYVNLMNVSETSLTILWFDNLELLVTELEDASNIISCVKNIHGPFVITDVKEGVTYTICIFISTDSIASPLNCLALATNPNYKSRSWISNGQKSITIGISTAVLIVLCFSSGIAAFLVIRRHPNLLRGSKRIIIVRRREINAVVLPEGIQLSPCSSPDSIKSEEVNYITPLGTDINKRKDSKMSGTGSQSSDTSYISGIEPNLLQLISWRNNRAKDEIPPPLPPHPPRIPSLSKAVDSRLTHLNLDLETVKDSLF